MRKSKLLSFSEGGMPLEPQTPTPFVFPWKTAVFLSAIVVVIAALIIYNNLNDDGKETA